MVAQSTSTSMYMTPYRMSSTLLAIPSLSSTSTLLSVVIHRRFVHRCVSSRPEPALDSEHPDVEHRPKAAASPVCKTQGRVARRLDNAPRFESTVFSRCAVVFLSLSPHFLDKLSFLA